jgi:hypothetical protein
VRAVLFTTAHCPARNRETYGYAIEYVVVLQGIYEGVKKHAYTERGQKCTRAYIKRVHNVGN